MSDLIAMTCPSCGGRLQISNDIQRFACRFCGNEFLVRRGSGTISLAPVIESINSVKTGVDRASTELSVIRLQNEISALKDRIEKLRTKRNKTINLILAEIPLFFLLMITGSNSQTAVFRPTIIFFIVVFFLLATVLQMRISKKLRETKRQMDEKTDQIAEYLESLRIVRGR